MKSVYFLVSVVNMKGSNEWVIIKLKFHKTLSYVKEMKSVGEDLISCGL